MHRTTLLIPRFQLLCEQPGDPAGGGSTPPTSATPPAASAAGPASSGPPSGVPGASAGAPGSAAAAPKFEYPEDRSKWIPDYRLNEVNQRLEQSERARQVYERKVRALMGVSEPADPRREQIREAMLEVFPEMRGIVDGSLAQQAGQGSSAEDAHWKRHAGQMVSLGLTALAKETGRDVKALGPSARTRMVAELRNFIHADRTGERNARYEEGDPTLIDELMADMRGFYFDPVRGASTVTAAQQAERVRRLPSTGPVGGIPPSDPGPKLKGKALHEAARQAFLQSSGQGG